MADPSQIIQVVGALLVLAGFAAVQANRMSPTQWSYLWLNALGSSALAVLAWLGRDWGFLLLEGVWALVSWWSMGRKVAHRGDGRGHATVQEDTTEGQADGHRERSVHRQ
ncbi:MAG TPA: hypothetical protein VFL99_14035 [Segeticoccus sp.]|uniref:CBU_0592 family membrane protein n=1 Tax=Segeticoccus sp. TaxID=2706531 RepID=UPI002D809ED4|nr:hypothetical protein [Segeticoccus sp.]HET8601444.1 hypothetical protein [Segeticoccus sp.]